MPVQEPLTRYGGWWETGPQKGDGWYSQTAVIYDNREFITTKIHHYEAGWALTGQAVVGSLGLLLSFRTVPLHPFQMLQELAGGLDFIIREPVGNAN